MKKLSISRVLPSLFAILLFLLFIWIYRLCSNSSASFISDNCEQSFIESDGYFCESKTVWDERKDIFQFQDKQNMIRDPDVIFFLTNWEPTFHCTHARRVGRGDGGKWVCDPYRLKSRHDCLIYSAGSNGNFEFEIEIKKLTPHCEIHSFDKNIYSCPTNICTFHQITFGDGVQPSNSMNWQTIIQKLNHTNRFIDILKIDIEGSEYSFFPLLLNSKKSTHPRQILVELHPVNVTTIHEFFDRMRNNHYVIFIKENNILAGPYFFEYAFIKLNPRFFVESQFHNKHI